MVSSVRSRKVIPSLLWGSMRFRAAFLTSLWGLFPSPAAFPRAGSCHALQHPSPFPFSLQLALEGSQRKPSSSSCSAGCQPGGTGLPSKQDPLPCPHPLLLASCLCFTGENPSWFCGIRDRASAALMSPGTAPPLPLPPSPPN